MSRAKNPKYESMSLEELKANMEKSRKQLEHACLLYTSDAADDVYQV